MEKKNTNLFDSLQSLQNSIREFESWNRLCKQVTDSLTVKLQGSIYLQYQAILEHIHFSDYSKNVKILKEESTDDLIPYNALGYIKKLIMAFW
jgi:hypothetical protein